MAKSFLLVPLAGLLLTGCMSDGMWSEAPGRPYYGASMGWWGQDVSSLDVFYDPLSRHGRWEHDARYGRIFRPGGIGHDWQPYRHGYWATDPRFGRRWVSSEPFGWATYHYGRWGHQPGQGWFWVPGTRFAGSWVNWRESGNRVGWAPMPPAGWNRREAGNNWWIHAPRDRIGRRDLDRHIERQRPGQVRDGPDRPSIIWRGMVPRSTGTPVRDPRATNQVDEIRQRNAERFRQQRIIQQEQRAERIRQRREQQMERSPARRMETDRIRARDGQAPAVRVRERQERRMDQQRRPSSEARGVGRGRESPGRRPIP